LSVKIRLRRTGAKKQASYRFVIADSRSPRDGRFLEIVGHYNPRRTPVDLVIDEEKVKRWLGRGAQPTASAAKLLAGRGLYDQSKVPVRKKRTRKEKKS
jgi:small subunit ribosomal protein S16